MDFKEHLNAIESGKDFINEGNIPMKMINGMVRNATWTLEQMKCTMEQAANIIGISYDENMADNKEVGEMYKKINNAYADAKMAFLNTLNKGLKGIK